VVRAEEVVRVIGRLHLPQIDARLPKSIDDVKAVVKFAGDAGLRICAAFRVPSEG